MQAYKTPLSFSLSFIVTRAPTICNLCKHGPLSFPSYARDTQRAAVVNFFQLILTSCNYFQLSFSCLLLDCTLDLTGCDCFQLPAIIFICLLLSCALILTDLYWSQLLPASCKSLHLFAVKLRTGFN